MCESGGNYGAINPSSGAGGAYQILPSTWDLYGGQGDPQKRPKAEQDRIAAEIWADSGAAPGSALRDPVERLYFFGAAQRTAIHRKVKRTPPGIRLDARKYARKIAKRRCHLSRLA